MLFLLFFSFLIDLYFLIPAMIGQFFILTKELVLPTGKQTNRANAGTETQQVTVEAKISKCSI